MDKTLPHDKRKGLVPLLKSGVVGPASYNEAIGWVTHSVPASKLCFYRITKHEGGDSFVIAPTMDIAVAVHFETIQLEEGEGSLFRLLDGHYGLHPDCMRGLPALLEYGPISMIVWDDDAGWKLA